MELETNNTNPEPNDENQSSQRHTNNSPILPSEPMDKKQFLEGYQRRLEVKLGHKNSQIVRNERLLETLPESLRISFEEMLQDNYAQRDQIQWELDEILFLLVETITDARCRIHTKVNVTRRVPIHRWATK